DDLIHSQAFYFDYHTRSLLSREFGVVGWCIYQRLGDAIFIPAGCAYQVFNLADCINVVCDFVSPESMDRYLALTREFREENQKKTWKEEVSQPSTMM
ncbi:hypothetical protein M422DRAFT_131532, partial [Sphaerobolus stellatus SS14]